MFIKACTRAARGGLVSSRYSKIFRSAASIQCVVVPFGVCQYMAAAFVGKCGATVAAGGAGAQLFPGGKHPRFGGSVGGAEGSCHCGGVAPQVPLAWLGR